MPRTASANGRKAARQAPPVRGTKRTAATAKSGASRGKYVYCIIDSSELTLGVAGIDLI